MRHRFALRGQGNPCASCQPITATGAQLSGAQQLPAQLGSFKGHQVQLLKTRPERPKLSGPLDRSVAELCLCAGLCLCPAPVPLPGATSAATSLRLSCSTLLVPTSANSLLFEAATNLELAGHYQNGRERQQCRVTAPPFLPQPPPWLLSSQYQPLLSPPTPQKGSIPPWG